MPREEPVLLVWYVSDVDSWEEETNGVTEREWGQEVFLGSEDTPTEEGLVKNQEWRAAYK